MNHRRRNSLSFLLLAAGALCVPAADVVARDRQVTHAPHPHVLTNINVWSPDSAWIVYDVRSPGAFDGRSIEQVEVATGRVERLYEAGQDAFCGVVTHHPIEPRVVFILGPERPTAEWSYAVSRRRGVWVDAARPGVDRALDAMNYAEPFVPGALRGGSHVHVFSPDGAWVSFTYDDALLSALDALPGAPEHDPNQRTIGVAVAGTPVTVARAHPRNHDGEYFSVIVARTTTEPRPGSDEISKAYEEGWVGRAGYTRPEGTRQQRALAFQGLVTARDGSRHAELFLVDLPDDLVDAAREMPLSSPRRRLQPPRGVAQRRLTFTDTRQHPGLVAAPQHWIRTSADGRSIAFLMKDDAGAVQLWTESPNGGKLRQVTHGSGGVESAFSWSPDDRFIAHVKDGSVCRTDVASGETTPLTARDTGASRPMAEACVFSPDGRRIAYLRTIETNGRRHSQVFVVDVP